MKNENDEKMRPIRVLAAELKMAERTFHRKLKSGDPAVRLALRQEVMWCHGTWIQFVAGYLDDLSEHFRQCDPDVTKVARHLSARLVQLHDGTPTSKFRLEQSKRLTDLAGELPDGEWDKFAADLENLPPLSKALK